MGIKYPWFTDHKKVPREMVELSVRFAEEIEFRDRSGAKEIYDLIQKSEYKPKGE